MLRFAAAEDARRAQRREPDDYTPNVRHEFRLFEPTYICQDGTTKLPKASVPREAIARARGKRVYQSQNLKEMPLDRIQRRQLLIADTWKDHAIRRSSSRSGRRGPRPPGTSRTRRTGCTARTACGSTTTPTW
jgi:hypothetical protein